MTVAYHYGMGKQDAGLTKEEFVNILKWDYFAQPPGVMVSILARISIAILLIRLFGVHKYFKWYLIVSTTLQTIFGLLSIILTWVAVTPVEGLWNPYLSGVHKWTTPIAKDISYPTQCRLQLIVQVLSRYCERY